MIQRRGAPDPGRRRGAAPRERIAGRYRVEGVIGRGGMAEVLGAFDESLHRPVAVKRLRPEFTQNTDLRRRFTREARAGARLHHPNVVAIYDVGEHDGEPFFVMERLPGRTLHDEIAEGPASMPRLRELAAEILGAIGAAHQLGIVHRDVKPANVLLDEHGRAKVGDFGIAHVSDDVHHTSTGLVLGTLSYLAPERLAGAPATPAADLYATGIVLFEAATSRPAFRADSPLALARAVADDEPTFTAEDRRRLDARFVAAVQRAMAKQPTDRFESAEGMLAAIGADETATGEMPPTAPVRTVPATRRIATSPEVTAVPRPDGRMPVAVTERAPRQSTRPRRRWAPVLVMLLVLGGAGGAIAIAAASGSSGSRPSDSASTSPSTISVLGPLGQALDALDRSIGR